MESVDENLKHPTEEIQQAAVAALRAVARRCFPGTMPADWRARLVKRYLAALADPNPAARRGFAMALGALDPATLGTHLADVVGALVRAATEVQVCVCVCVRARVCVCARVCIDRWMDGWMD
jgi:tubulin-specific chaperone D